MQIILTLQNIKLGNSIFKYALHSAMYNIMQTR